jgi:hypothetical protein
MFIYISKLKNNMIAGHCMMNWISLYFRAISRGNWNVACNTSSLNLVWTNQAPNTPFWKAINFSVWGVVFDFLVSFERITSLLCTGTIFFDFFYIKL